MRPILVCLLLAILYIIPLGLSLYQLNSPSIITISLILLGFVVSFAVYYEQFYKPFIKKRDDLLKLVIYDLLSVIHRKIMAEKPQITHLRINVMTVRNKWFPPWQKYLKIDYYYPNHGYPLSELELTYNNNIACCGTALKQNKQIAYDSILSHETRKDMTEAQKEITRNIK